MRDYHELGEGWSPEDGVVRRLEISDLESDVFGPEVLP